MDVGSKNFMEIPPWLQEQLTKYSCPGRNSNKFSLILMKMMWQKIWPFLEWADFEPWSACPVSCGDQTATRVSALWRSYAIYIINSYILTELISSIGYFRCGHVIVWRLGKLWMWKGASAMKRKRRYVATIHVQVRFSLWDKISLILRTPKMTYFSVDEMGRN